MHEIEKRLQDPVHKHMHSQFACLKAGQSIREALDTTRNSAPSARIVYFYVVDDSGELLGVVPTRRLLLSSPDTCVGTLASKPVISIPSNATVQEACQYFQDHRLLGFPVTDSQNKLVGVVDIELYTSGLGDIDLSARNEQLFELAGIHLLNGDQQSSTRAFKNRFPWLLCNIVAGLLAALLAGCYQQELEKAVGLALFMPILLALSESVSIQSVSLSLQILQGRRSNAAEITQRLRSEVLTGAYLGTAAASLVASVAFLWLRHYEVMVSVLAGITGGIICAALIGVSVPHLLHLLNRKPEIAAGPVALALTDLAALLLYFTIARSLLSS
jgi:magnesium transporter